MGQAPDLCRFSDFEPFSGLYHHEKKLGTSIFYFIYYFEENILSFKKNEK